jgi:hypothetical protein
MYARIYLIIIYQMLSKDLYNLCPKNFLGVQIWYEWERNIGRVLVTRFQGEKHRQGFGDEISGKERNKPFGRPIARWGDILKRTLN